MNKSTSFFGNKRNAVNIRTVNPFFETLTDERSAKLLARSAIDKIYHKSRDQDVIASNRRQWLVKPLHEPKNLGGIYQEWHVNPLYKPKNLESIHQESLNAFDDANIFGYDLVLEDKSLRDRMTELKSWAKEEGDPFSEQSEKDFFSFFRINNLKNPNLFLLPNGNLRAVWRKNDRQIGVQFIGKYKGQFVLLDGDGLKPNQTLGMNDLQTIMGIVEGAGLSELWRRQHSLIGEYSAYSPHIRRPIEVRSTE